LAGISGRAVATVFLKAIIVYNANGFINDSIANVIELCYTTSGNFIKRTSAEFGTGWLKAWL